MNNNDNQFVFNPRSLNLRFWTIKTSRTGRNDFGGRLWCEEGIDGNVDKIIRQFVYEKREAGDKLLDLRDLGDIKDQINFTIMKYDDRNDINNYRVNQILSFQGGFLVLKLGTILYIRVDGTTHVQICNMLDSQSGMAKLTWDVRRGKPRQITDEMYETWDISETFRQEHREEFQAATINEKYEPEQGPFANASETFRQEHREEFQAATINEKYEPEQGPFANALRAAEAKKKGPEEWSPTSGDASNPNNLTVVRAEEQTLDDLDLTPAKPGRKTPPAPRKKVAEG